MSALFASEEKGEGLPGFLAANRHVLAATMAPRAHDDAGQLAIERFLATEWSTATVEDLNWARIMLVTAGTWGDSPLGSSGFIEVPIVVDALVAGLATEAVAASCADILLKRARQRDLMRCRERIAERLAGGIPSVAVRGQVGLLVARTFGPAKADVVRVAAPADDVALALVGDDVAGQRLLAAFAGANEYQAFVKAARDLGTWGDGRALEVLVRGLTRDVASHSSHHDIHGRLAVLEAIGRIEEDSILFTHMVTILKATSDSTFALKVRPLREYVRQVNAWAQARFEIRPLPADAWFLRYHGTPILAPPPTPAVQSGGEGGDPAAGDDSGP